MLDIRRIKKEYNFDGDGFSAFASVTLRVADNVFIGTASCAPEDMEFCSEKTGLAIAETRAMINYLTWVRDIELGQQLKILEHLENGVNAKEEKDKNGYMIYRAANRCREEIKFINEEVKKMREELKEFIDNKAKLYDKLRARRSKENNYKSFGFDDSELA